MPIEPTFSDLTPAAESTFNVNQWFSGQFVPLVPDTVAPFLAAHGFLVTNGTEHFIDGDFAGYLLNMQRQHFSHADTIQAMLNTMTAAYNQGRLVNDLRYKDIIRGRQEALQYQQDQTNAARSEFDGSYSLFIADLGAITADAPSLAEWTSSIEQLVEYAGTFEGDASEAIALFLSRLGTLSVYLPTLEEFDAIVSTLNAKINAFDNNAILSGQLAVYLEEVAGLTDDAPQIAAWTLALDTLHTKLSQLDTAINELRSSYALDESEITTAIGDALAAVASAAAAYRAEVAAMKAKQASIEGSINSLLSTETTDLAAHAVELVAALDSMDDQYDVQLAAAQSALAAMEAAVANFSTASADIVAEIEAQFPAHESVITSLLGELTDAFDATETTLVALLTTLRNDYASHASTATAFLTDLGATRLARINEQFDNLKSDGNQRLANRGFYSSAIVTQMEARVERERQEAITELNDKLNREKWENQHRLYDQQQAMRGAHISVHQQLLAIGLQTTQFRTDMRDRLNARLLDTKRLALQSRQETERVRQELFRLQVGVSQSFNQAFIEITSAIAQGRSQLQSARLAVSRGQAEDRQKIFSQIAETFGRSLAGEDRFAALEAQMQQQQQSILVRIEELGQSWAATSGKLLEMGIQARASTADVNASVRSRYHDIVLRQKLARAEGRLSGVKTQADVLEAGLRSRGISAQVTSEVKRTYYDLILRQKIALVDAQGSAVNATISSGQAIISARATAATTESGIRTAYYDLILKQQSQKAQLRLSGATSRAELVSRHVNETTNVAAALFEFSERREDSHPSIGDMAALVASLGDDQ